ncbi:unnamed protein product [Linum tenue]|uniref:Exostosin GT47 domain-containing protein n=3 Tax=Linum tenue TaxID=586396 RepID=A0AAV0M5X6_9ROSI|nr:unnamed protein product [Linum tenue]
MNYDKVGDPKPTGRCHVRNMSVYVYELPSKFNSDLLRNCTRLNRYRNLCPDVVNHGLGQPLSVEANTPTKEPIWFAPYQFAVEEIFHARMLNHPCRTNDPARANLFYVPFYGGFHMSSMGRETNYTARDELAVQLAEHVEQQQPWWGRRNGKDHFMVLGRTAWDFMRSDRQQGVVDYGSNTLLNLPAVRNMSVFVVERHPSEGNNQLGIPYPSYFHPYTVDQVRDWQRKVAGSNRPYLFSYIGARRKEGVAAAIRDELMQQCSESEHCMLLNCTADASKCSDPKEVLRVMMASRFCLQPRGDSFTRRSVFDSLLAGCLPVLFSRHTAYTQYQMYLPENTTSYSVFLWEDEKMISDNGLRKVNIEEELMKIGSGKVEEMRKVVVDLIPRLTFAHPNASGDKGFEDVVDVALSSLLRLVY